MTTARSAARAQGAVHHLTVSDHDGYIAEADIVASTDCVCLTFHVQSGHNRVDARSGASCLVDGVLTHCDQCESDDHGAAQPDMATVD